MFIPIPIPIGVKRTVAVQGAVWKFVACAHCHEDFAYLLQLEAIGEDIDLLFIDTEDSTKRAQAHAEHNLSEQSRNVVSPVPCPCCGFYQEDMARLLKEEGTSDLPFKMGMGVAVVSCVPLAFPIPHVWIVTAVGVFAGLSLMAYADLYASRFDPNAGDPKPRKLLGQRHAVWGEQLAHLRDKLANAAPAAAPSPTTSNP